MEYLKARAPIAIALLVGMAVGILIDPSMRVKAAGQIHSATPTTIRVQRVMEGMNSMSNIGYGAQVIGFSCNNTGCYIAAQQ